MARFLADESFPLPTVEELRRHGFDIAAVVETMAQSADPTALHRAVTESRVLLTCDKDFGELAFRAGLPAQCGIVLLRLRTRVLDEFTRTALKALSTQTDWQGMFAVVTDKRIRLRKLPQQP